jgi:hypothetical protein
MCFPFACLANKRRTVVLRPVFVSYFLAASSTHDPEMPLVLWRRESTSVSMALSGSLES